MQYLFADFESFFDRKSGFDLRNMSVTEYIRDSRFKVQGLGVWWGSRTKEGKVAPMWLKPVNISNFVSEWEKEFGWGNTCIIAHNSKFDSAVLAWRYGIVAGQYICTQAMSYAVNGTTIGSHSLESLARHYGLEPKGHLNTDGKRELTEAEEQELITYGLRDVELLVEVFNKMKLDFPESQYGPLDWTIRSFVQPQLQLDVKLLEECSKKEAIRREEFFKKPGWEKENFSSNKKFPELLRSKGYEVPTKISPRTGKEIPALALGDVKFLEMLEGDDEELKEICEARVAAKSTLLETRSGKLAKIGRTGSWPFDVWFSGAKQTHRYSGGNAGGGNPQNFTRGSDLRRAVVAPKGKTLIVGDFSNIELRINAWLCNQENLIKALAEGQDVYSHFATEYYGFKITKENKEERQFGKTSVLGLGYNMGWQKFQRTVRLQLKKTITDIEAKRAVSIFRSMYWNIPKYWDYLQGCLEQMADGGFGELANLPAVKIDGSNFILPSGLKIRYPNLRQEMKDGKHQWIYDVYRKGKEIERATLYGGKMLENLCQALAGEICKEAIELLKPSDNLKVVGQVHDELLCVVDEPDTDLTQVVKSAMEVSPAWWKEIVLRAEVNSGQNWLEAK